VRRGRIGAMNYNTAAYLKARRERLAANGLCESCGKEPARKGRRRCSGCAAKQLERYHEFRANGLCGYCGARPAAMGRQCCEPCLDKAKEAAKLRRRNGSSSPEEREILLAMRRANARAKPEEARVLHLKKAYGLSLREWEAILRAQGGRCAICGRAEPDARDPRKTWHTDHDHQTGRVRGILCGGCNLGLGCFGDNVESLMRAVRYLKQRPLTVQAAHPKRRAAQLVLVGSDHNAKV
jgi:hypothetical protein